jgi:predicted TIM-barrel fold metal-dependent hydrolase
MMGGAISYVAEHVQMVAEEAGTPLPARRLKSVYFDTGQTGRAPRGIALAAKVFGADRILFGTDSGPVATIGPTIASVKQANLTPEEKDLIFSGNARRLLTARGIT